MKMLNSFGPNPRMVRMFLAEKGLELPMEQLDLPPVPFWDPSSWNKFLCAGTYPKRKEIVKVLLRIF